MRLDVLGQWTADRSGETGREIGAAVVRGESSGGMVLELGPADGPPSARLALSSEEANRLVAAVDAVAHGKPEEILIVDDDD